MGERWVIPLTIGHKCQQIAEPDLKNDPHRATHKWRVFVRSPSGVNLAMLVDKVCQQIAEPDLKNDPHRATHKWRVFVRSPSGVNLAMLVDKVCQQIAEPDLKNDPHRATHKWRVFVRSPSGVNLAMLVDKVCQQIAEPDLKNDPHRATHKWRVFVRSPSGVNLAMLVDKVFFELHQSFRNPKRTVDKPPFEVWDSAYGGFTINITIHFKFTHRQINHSYDLPLKYVPVDESYDTVPFDVQNPSSQVKSLLLEAKVPQPKVSKSADHVTGSSGGSAKSHSGQKSPRSTKVDLFKKAAKKPGSDAARNSADKSVSENNDDAASSAENVPKKAKKHKKPKEDKEVGSPGAKKAKTLSGGKEDKSEKALRKQEKAAKKSKASPKIDDGNPDLENEPKTDSNSDKTIGSTANLDNEQASPNGNADRMFSKMKMACSNVMPGLSTPISIQAPGSANELEPGEIVDESPTRPIESSRSAQKIVEKILESSLAESKKMSKRKQEDEAKTAEESGKDKNVSEHIGEKLLECNVEKPSDPKIANPAPENLVHKPDQVSSYHKPKKAKKHKEHKKKRDESNMDKKLPSTYDASAKEKMEKPPSSNAPVCLSGHPPIKPSGHADNCPKQSQETAAVVSNNVVLKADYPKVANKSVESSNGKLDRLPKVEASAAPKTTEQWGTSPGSAPVGKDGSEISGHKCLMDPCAESSLLALQARIMDIQDRKTAQELVDLLEAQAVPFTVGPSTLDFDICLLSKEVLYKLWRVFGFEKNNVPGESGGKV